MPPANASIYTVVSTAPILILNQLLIIFIFSRLIVKFNDVI